MTQPQRAEMAGLASHAVRDLRRDCGEDGDTFVIKAGPVHEVLRTNSVGEPVYASPAVANGRIDIRGERHLFAIGRP